MLEQRHGIAALDARLAEIDRKLRSIQAELVPGSQPAPAREPSSTPAEPPATEPSPAESPPGEAGAPAPPETTQAASSAESHSGRAGPLASALAHSRRQSRHQREPADPQPHVSVELSTLAATQERLLELLGELIEVLRQSAARAAPPATATERHMTLSAGPFTSNEQVREFARALSGLSGVGEVRLRGYEGENRALLDVQVASPTA